MPWFGKGRETTEHEYVRERLSAYLDGALVPGERGRLEAHLATCRACRWELDTLRRTVQWTMELPRVPVPRAFTIPVPAQRVRAVSRSWALPVLQGATALVAVLFLLAVVGQAFLPTFFPTSAPQPAAVAATSAASTLERQAVEATVQVEAAPQAESPALPETAEQPDTLKAMAPAAASVAEVTQPPAADSGRGFGGAEVSVTEEAAAIATQMAEVAAMTAAPLGMGVGMGPGLPATPTPGPPSIGAIAPTAAPSATPPPTVTDTPQPSPTTAPTDTPQPSPTPTPEPVVVAPTTVAEVPAAAPPEEPLPAVRDESEVMRRSVASGLVTAQIVLGTAFVVLGLLTVVLMVRRLRKS